MLLSQAWSHGFLHIPAARPLEVEVRRFPDIHEKCRGKVHVRSEQQQLAQH